MAQKPHGVITIWGNKCPMCSFVTSKKVCPRCGSAITPDAKTLVFEDSNLRRGFAQVPNAVLRDAKLSHAAVRLYALLLSYAWSENECWPGQDTLADAMGCTARTVYSTLNELREAKLICWRRRGQGKSSIYTIKKLSTRYMEG